MPQLSTIERGHNITKAILIGIIIILTIFLIIHISNERKYKTELKELEKQINTEKLVYNNCVDGWNQTINHFNMCMDTLLECKNIVDKYCG